MRGLEVLTTSIRPFVNWSIHPFAIHLFSRYLSITSIIHLSVPSIEKHFWQITKQIISVIKIEVLVFVKTNCFKCPHFNRSQIKVYQIFQTYSGTITNRWEKFKTMVNYQIFLIFKMMIGSKVVRSAYLSQKASHLHL